MSPLCTLHMRKRNTTGILNCLATVPTYLPTYLTTYHPTYVPMYVCPVYQVYLCVRQIHYTVYTVHTENVCFYLFTVVVVGLS